MPNAGKTVVFAVTRCHVETLVGMRDEGCADLNPHPTTRFADFVVSCLRDGPVSDSSAIIRRFKDEKSRRFWSA